MSAPRKLNFPSESEDASRSKKPNCVQPDCLTKRKPINPKVNINQPGTLKTLTKAEKRERGMISERREEANVQLSPSVR